MKKKYYAKISLATKEYCNIACINDTNSYLLTESSKCWKLSQNAYDAPWDTCYDYITESEAEKLALSWGVDKNTFSNFPENSNESYEIAIEIGFIPEYSKDSWHVPYFDSGLALEKEQYCGTIMSDKLHIINDKLHDHYCIDCYSSCWRGNKKEMEEIALALKLDMACVNRLEGSEQYGLLIFEHQWKKRFFSVPITKNTTLNELREIWEPLSRGL